MSAPVSLIFFFAVTQQMIVRLRRMAAKEHIAIIVHATHVDAMFAQDI